MKKSIHSREYRVVQEALVDMRLKAGLTQRQAAARLDREQSFVWRIEKGERRLDVVEFHWVCRVLGYNAREVYAGLVDSFEGVEGSSDRGGAIKAAEAKVAYRTKRG